MLQALSDRWTEFKQAHRRFHNLAKASVVVVSPAKSGRTWLRAMQSHVYHLTYGTPADQIVHNDRFHRLDKRIPSIYFSHVTSESARVRRALEPAALADRLVVAMVRDPRDIVVSRYHQLRHRVSERSRRQLGAVVMEELQLFDFLLMEQIGLDFVIDAVNTMHRFTVEHPNCHLFRYEDLKADPAGELARYLGVLGHDIQHSTIEAAVEFARFENLKKREAEGFYKSGILRPGATGSADAFKVRRGKVGGYHDDLTPAQVAELDRSIDAALVAGFGYRTDERPATPPLRASA